MKRKQVTKKLLTAILTVSMAFGITACGSAGNNSGDVNRKDAASIKEDNLASSESAATEEKSETNSAAEVSEKKTEYPLTIKTYGTDGKELETTYEKAPEKVLAVYQGSIETLLALGLEERIVGTAGLDNEVPEEQKAAFSKTNYLDEFTPSLETVTMLEPDMIFSWGSLFKEKTLGDVSSWVEKGVNIYMNTNTRPTLEGGNNDRTLENEYTDLLNIGKIFDVQEKAEAIVKDMKDTVEQVINKTKDMEDKPDALILESGKDTFSNYGASSLGGDMLTKLGGVLVSPDASSLGKEDVVTANPDVIFVVYMPYSGDDPEQVKQEKLDVILKDEAFASLDAVKNGRVVPIILSEMYASTTRTQEGIETFAEGLYPEIDLGIEK